MRIALAVCLLFALGAVLETTDRAAAAGPSEQLLDKRIDPQLEAAGDYENLEKWDRIRERDQALKIKTGIERAERQEEMEQAIVRERMERNRERVDQILTESREKAMAGTAAGGGSFGAFWVTIGICIVLTAAGIWLWRGMAGLKEEGR